MPRKSRLSNPQKSALYSIAAMLVVLFGVIVLYIQDLNTAPQVGPAISIAPNVLIVDTITGSAYLNSNQNTTETELTPGSTVSPNSILRTDGQSQAVLRYRDGTTVQISAATKLANLQPLDASSAKHLRLDSGNLQIEAQPQLSGAPMEIYTSHAIVKVLGTRFTLAIKDTYTELAVDEGAVDFSRPGDVKNHYIIRGHQIAALGEQVDFIEINDPSDPIVHDFSLIDVGTGKAILGYDPIAEGATISLSELPDSGVNIRVNATGRVNKVHITNANRKQKEQYPPFTVAGDLLHQGGGHFTLRLKPGRITISATPYDRDGVAGASQSLTINYID